MKLSIIIPVYNVAAYIRRCLNSVINQTYQDIEIICVDDGSNDGSEKTLDEYTMIDSRINVIHIANSGAATARNIGLEVASGDYTGFVDADDYIDLCMYETLIKKALNSNADIIQCDYDRVYDNAAKNKIMYRSAYRMLNSQREILSAYFMQEIHSSACSKIFRSAIAKGVRFEESISIGEDSLWVYECCKKSSLVCITDYLGYHYYYRNLSATNSRLCPAKFQPLYIIEKQADENRHDDQLYKICRYVRIKLSISMLLRINEEQVFLEKYADLKKHVLENSNIVCTKSFFNFETKVAVLLLRIAPWILHLIYNTHRSIKKYVESKQQAKML